MCFPIKEMAPGAVSPMKIQDWVLPQQAPFELYDVFGRQIVFRRSGLPTLVCLRSMFRRSATSCRGKWDQWATIVVVLVFYIAPIGEIAPGSLFCSTVAPVRPSVYYYSASRSSYRWHRGCLGKTTTKLFCCFSALVSERLHTLKTSHPVPSFAWFRIQTKRLRVLHPCLQNQTYTKCKRFNMHHTFGYPSAVF